MRPHQTQNLLHSKRSHQENVMANYGMKKNGKSHISEWLHIHVYIRHTCDSVVEEIKQPKLLYGQGRISFLKIFKIRG